MIRCGAGVGSLKLASSAKASIVGSGGDAACFGDLPLNLEGIGKDNHTLIAAPVESERPSGSIINEIL
jgi:hypothetical protein